MIERSRVRVPAGAAGAFSSPGSTFCADSFGYPFYPRVTAVARKNPCRSAKKCKWQECIHPTTYVAWNEVTL